MGENSGIQWTHHTFNPWVGCQRVSPGCTHCYAETYDRRVGGAKLPDGTKSLRWGPTAPRVRTSAANWRQPLKWNADAVKANVAADLAGQPRPERPRVFCSSLADVFEGREEVLSWRRDLFDLIASTPNLDWLLLTKRPHLCRSILEGIGWANGMRACTGASMARDWLKGTPPANVWLGTTVEDQQRANERIPALLSVPARVRFLSCEPLLERVDLSRWLAPTIQPPGINWVIVGGESGPGARPFALEWARDLVRQSRAAGVAPFVKQLGARPVFGAGAGDLPDSMWQALDANGYDHEEILTAASEGRVRFLDAAGGDPAEWPADLRVREFPEVAP